MLTFLTVPIAVDSYEFAALETHVSHADLMGLDSKDEEKAKIQKELDAATAAKDAAKMKKLDAALIAVETEYKGGDSIENKPHFHEWVFFRVSNSRRLSG